MAMHSAQLVYMLAAHQPRSLSVMVPLPHRRCTWEAPIAAAKYERSVGRLRRESHANEKTRLCCLLCQYPDGRSPSCFMPCSGREVCCACVWDGDGSRQKSPVIGMELHTGQER